MDFSERQLNRNSIESNKNNKLPHRELHKEKKKWQI